MEALEQYHREAATFLVRVFLGLLFFFQGYDAVFRIKIRNVISAYKQPFASRGIPGFISVPAIWFTSLSELIFGFLLVAGFFTSISLFILGINLLVASVAFAIVTPLWNMRHVFPRFILLIFLLVVPAGWNLWSADYLLFNL